MPPAQQILLDTAFNSVRYETELFNQRTGRNLDVTFKDVVDNYLLLVNQTQGLI